VGLRIFGDDREAGRWLRSLQGLPTEPIGLRAGDLSRTMGGGAPARFEGVVTRAPVDLLRVRIDGTEHVALSHVVLRDRWWWGRVVLVMNAQFIGRHDVVPRSHPNDGRADVLEALPSMPPRARVQAWRRSVTGTHLPHPSLRVSHVQHWEQRFDRPVTCWLDGVRIGRVVDVSVEVVPDGLVVYA
jgi:diacylglycerol kinase family enzyme